MRYYQPFPVAIPLLKAGCSRVTHPSATDPGTEVPFSVRLECVRHAASVHPEPGSNSLKISILTPPSGWLKIFPELSSALYFFEL